MFSHNDSYSHNVFRDNGAGVAVMYTKNVTMEYNYFLQNWGTSAYGLLLKDISDSKIRHNTFQSNTIGIYMEGSNRILVEYNEFKENGWAAKVQASCVSNTITNNNFLGNTFDIATNGDLVLNEYHGNFWDKYEGYDLDKDQVGDVPFHPVGLYATLVERIPETGMLYLSFIVTLLDKLEKMIPAISPENLVDNRPRMSKIKTESPT
jgi:nitrous oxidase accessory protein